MLNSLILLSASLMSLLGSAYLRLKRKAPLPLALVFKGLCTLVAGLLALYGYLNGGGTASLLIALGLFCCAGADVLLEINFFAGVGLFGLGHLGYCAAFLSRQVPGSLPLILGGFALLSGGMIFGALVLRKKSTQSVWPYFGYALILSLMLCCAMPLHPLTLLGALLFAVSDFTILYRIVNPQAPEGDIACISLYYSAQFLLALSAVLPELR